MILENFDDCKTPKHLRITEEIKDEFVNILKPVVFLSVFGKDNNSVIAAQTALKNLSCKFNIFKYTRIILFFIEFFIFYHYIYFKIFILIYL